MAINLDFAYQNCIKFASNHYENFPVISFFIRKHLRRHVAAVYCFARYADDIVDEGTDSMEIKLKNLNQFRIDFMRSLEGVYCNDFWAALHNTINEFKISTELFLSLLKAFEQDIKKNRFSDFDEILDYCNNSANPVGRIILRLHGFDNIELDLLSDKICTGLQLTNFYQDLEMDLMKNRIYIPINELEKFNVCEKTLLESNFNDNVMKLLKFQIGRNFEFYNEGKLLLKYLPAKLKIQIKLTINGGEKILAKIEQLDYNVLKFRPKLTKLDILNIFLKTLI